MYNNNELEDRFGKLLLYKLTKTDRFPIPEFNINFEIKLNPLYDYDLAKKVTQYIYETSTMDAERFLKIKNCGLMTAYYYPNCADKYKLEHLSKFFMLTFVIDDFVEPHCLEASINQTLIDDFSRAMNKLNSNEFISLSDCKPYILSFNAVLEKILYNFNEVQKLRCLNGLILYINGASKEVELLKKKNIINNMEDYFEVRELTSGCMSAIQLIEYSENVFVTEDEWNNEDLKKLIQLNVRLEILENDIFSFEKEFKETNEMLDKMSNSVAVISRSKNLNIYDSMVEVIHLFKNMENEYIELESKMLADSIYRDDCKCFIRNLVYCVSSAYITPKITDRYRNVKEVDISPREKFDKYLLV